MSKLQALSDKEVTKIREAFIKNSHARFMKYFFSHRLFGKREAYTKEIRKANLERLARLIRSAVLNADESLLILENFQLDLAIRTTFFD